MSQNLDAVIDIEDLVKYVLWISKKPKSERQRFLELAIYGYRELCTNHVSDGLKMVKVTPTSINTIPFPDDLELFIAVGEPVNGKFEAYSHNRDIITTTTGTVEETQTASDGEGVSVQNLQSNGYAGRGGVNTLGYYTIDYSNLQPRIFLNSQTRSEVLLLYKSSNVKLSSTTYIPKRYVQALFAWIMWKDIEGDDMKVDIIDRREMAYNRRVDEIKTRDINIDDIMDEIYKSYTMLPRR